MLRFTPSALTATPQAIADYMTETVKAPAALYSIWDGPVMAQAASGTTRKNGPDATPDQSFEIGSQTKMMTALVVLQLEAEGRLDLSRPLAEYLDPTLLSGIANADLATVEQALEMRTGIPNYTDIERPDGRSMSDFIAENPDEVFDDDEIVALLQDLPATSEVGTDYAYSNTNYFYLSRVIEAVTGQGLGEVFAERIFEPLGMTDTYLNDFREDPKKLSSYFGLGKRLIDVTDALVDANGEGGVISTTADMTLFLKALLVDKTLAAPEILARMTDFSDAGTDARGFLFKSGLVQLEFEGIGQFLGFSGGTLGTDSATFLHVESGRILSGVVSQSNLESSSTGGLLSAALAADQDPAWAPAQGPIAIDGVSAAQLELAKGGTVTAQNARLSLEGGLKSAELTFTDGSDLHLGGRKADRLKAGDADDQLRGRAGDDRMVGGAGDDKLVGGQGDDRLIGGAGSDWLEGGQGADTFVFKADPGQSRDVIADFSAEDRLVLKGQSIEDIAIRARGTALTLEDGDVIFLAGVFDTDNLAFL